MKYLYLVINITIPSFFLFISNNLTVFTFLKECNILSPKANVENIQMVFFLIGIIWTGCALPIQLFSFKSKYERQSKSYEELLKYNKNNFITLIRQDINNHTVKLNTRIFVPQSDIKGFLRKFFFKETKLKLIHINGISDDFHGRKLSFKVNGKKTEGMVGRSFAEKALITENDLSNSNLYELNKSQKMMVDNVKFCSTIPILDENENKDALAIVSLDSDTAINMNNNQRIDFEKNMKYFASFIDKQIKF